MHNEFILDFCSEELRIALNLLKKQIKNHSISNKETDNQTRTYLDKLDSDSAYPVHLLAFKNSWFEFLNYYLANIQNCHINEVDLLGNTALIIAVKRGHKEFVQVLIFLNADALIKNNEGWSAISEAISYGELKTVEALLKLFNIQNRIRISESKNMKMINRNRDFIIEFSWDIKTWIPILSKFLPSDNCKLTKSGSRLRLDQTLSDFNNQKWCRGNISCIINPNILKNRFNVYLLDNQKKVYQILNLYEENIPKDELMTLMTSEIVDAKLETKDVVYMPKTNFWSFSYDAVKKQVGNFDAHMYDMNNVFMFLKRRREHISQKQMELNKIVKKRMQKGNFSVLKDSEYDLIDPDVTSKDVTWDQYKESMMKNISIDIGRKQILKNNVKEIKLSVGMSDEFPLDMSEILDVFEMILPEKKVNRIRDIFTMKMPPGFPVTIDIPIVPTVSANISFLSALVGQPNLEIDENLFLIPQEYLLVKKI